MSFKKPLNAFLFPKVRNKDIRNLPRFLQMMLFNSAQIGGKEKRMLNTKLGQKVY